MSELMHVKRLARMSAWVLLVLVGVALVYSVLPSRADTPPQAQARLVASAECAGVPAGTPCAEATPGATAPTLRARLAAYSDQLLFVALGVLVIFLLSTSHRLRNQRFV